LDLNLVAHPTSVLRVVFPFNVSTAFRECSVASLLPYFKFDVIVVTLAMAEDHFLGVYSALVVMFVSIVLFEPKLLKSSAMAKSTQPLQDLWVRCG
jgi:hypothetical protein